MNQQRSEIADEVIAVEVIAVVSTRFGLLSTGPESAISPFAVSNK